jgi:hypothetical protein
MALARGLQIAEVKPLARHSLSQWLTRQLQATSQAAANQLR